MSKRTLAQRLTDPGVREAIRTARERLDADDQRWMLEEIERLERKTGDLQSDLHRIRGERDHAVKAATKAVAEEVARLTRELSEARAASAVWQKSAEERSVALALVSGALVDAGRPVGDAMDFGRQVAALAEGERGWMVVREREATKPLLEVGYGEFDPSNLRLRGLSGPHRGAALGRTPRQVARGPRHRAAGERIDP